jgi:exodeoxyribonuclease VII large subunit
MTEPKILTVTQLNMYVRSLLESSVYLKDVYIVGEISNFTNHYKTGHFYFSLKDESGLIRAVMFKTYTGKLKFVPQNGMRVICRGRVSLYERDGQYQLYVTQMQPDGLGALSLAFEQLKEKLEKEGLFDEAHKKPIPKMPLNIAVITSPTGAALQDILNVLRRRFPVAKVLLFPVLVQGDGAAPQMVQALKTCNRLKCADVIIIGRGGGSIEDLWAFNEEILARAIYESEIPVISGVGHETDFTISDFVADLRANTPTAAAELATPDKFELVNIINQKKAYLLTALKRSYKEKRLTLEAIENKQCLKNPMFSVNMRRMELDRIFGNLLAGYKEITVNKKNIFISQIAKLDAMSPLAVLSRGYSVALRGGKPILSAKQVNIGDRIEIKLNKGSLNALVEDKNE